MPKRPLKVSESVERVRKNMDMDPRKLAEAQRILGTRTETETVDEALDYVAFTSEVTDALERLYALGGLNEAPYRKVPASPRRQKVAER